MLHIVKYETQNKTELVSFFTYRHRPEFRAASRLQSSHNRVVRLVRCLLALGNSGARLYDLLTLALDAQILPKVALVPPPIQQQHHQDM